MKSYTNCPNCGAEVDIRSEKCAYCDTPYDWCIPTKSSGRAVLYANDAPFMVTTDEIEREKRIDTLYKEQKQLELEMYQEELRRKAISEMLFSLHKIL